MVFEKWEGFVRVGEAFQAKPLFDVDNPITAIDPSDLSAYHPTCQFRPVDEGCSVSGDLWNGNKRSVIHPGQQVQNAGPEEFYTSPLGDPVEAGSPHAIRQFVTRQGWDTRQCCGNEVVFRIQSFSDGVYIANPREPAGMVEFDVRNP
jgi:hypothetical protein